MKDGCQPNDRRSPINKRLALLIAVALALAAVGVFAWRPWLRSYRLSQGRLAMENRDPLQALQYFHAARQLAPDHAETHFQLARVYRRLGQLDRVRESLSTAWRLGYDVAALQREQWLVLAQTGDLKEAEPRLLARLSDPQETRADEISEALVRGYFGNLRFSDAERVLTAWQTDYPDDAEPHFLRGYFYEAFYRYKDAVAEYELGLVKAPGRTDGRLRLSGVLVRQEDYARAERELARCLDEQPLDLQVRTEWAAYLFAVGRGDEAHHELRQVLIRAPDNPEALRLMGQIELAAGRPEEAFRWLLPAAEKTPCDTSVRQALGQALQVAGRADEAAPHFRYVEEAERELRHLDVWLPQVLENPADVSLRYKIGVTVLRYRSPPDGLRWLRTVLEIDPDHVETHRALADYYAQQGDQQAAQRHRQQAESP
ncbi:MAG: tetratricopeptide repeat protein [Pirellulaceae bacterium]|nr:tetratricopeptide repeat protein [Pirellulaceae bacterium]